MGIYSEVLEGLKNYFNDENTTANEQLHGIFNDFYKKRKIPKLIESFVRILSTDLNSFDDLKEFPKEILDKFSLYCQELPPIQSVTLLKFCMENIKESFSLNLKHFDYVVEICIGLLIRLMMNTKYFDHNISQFEDLVTHLPKNCIIPLLTYTLENREKLSILSSSLQLCYVYGEITTFLDHYFEINFKKELDLDSNGWNLNNIHWYFNDWKEIFSIIKHNKNNNCKYFYALLILQNIRTLDTRKKEIEPKLIENSAKLLYKLAEKSIKETDSNRSIWRLLLNNLPLLITYWNSEIILNFIQRLIEDNKCAELGNEEFFYIYTFQNSFISLMWKKILCLLSSNEPLFEKVANFFDHSTDAKDESHSNSSRSLFFQLGKELEECLENKEKSELNDERELENIFKIFSLIPIHCLSTLSQRRCLIGLIGLLSKFNMQNDQKLFCYLTIIKLLSNSTNGQEPEIFNFISIGSVLKWLMKCECQERNLTQDFPEFQVQLKIYKELLDILLLLSFNSTHRWIKSEIFFTYLKKIGNAKRWLKLNERDKEICLITFNSLFHLLTKVMKKKDDIISSAAKTFFTTNLKEFCEVVLNCIKNTDFDPSRSYFLPVLQNLALIESATQDFKENPELKEEFKEIMRLILPSATKFLNDSDDLQIVSCSYFYINASKTESDILNTFWRKLMKIYIKLGNAETDSDDMKLGINKVISNVITLCESSDLEEIIVPYLLDSTMNSIGMNKNDLNSLKLWLQVPFDSVTKKDNEKSRVLRTAAAKLLVVFPHLIRSYKNEPNHEALILIMKLTEFILRPAKFLDVNFYVFPFHIFIAVIECKSEFEDKQHFAAIFNGLFSILNALLINHLGLMIQKIPIVIKYISSLMQLLIQNSDQSTIKSLDNELPLLENCAMNLNRLFYQITRLKIHFLRVGHYLIADYVSELENITLNPTVKEILVNGIYTVVDLCDEHAVVELQKNLSAPSRELFNQLYIDYERHYKFKPKDKYKK